MLNTERIRTASCKRASELGEITDPVERMPLPFVLLFIVWGALWAIMGLTADVPLLDKIVLFLFGIGFMGIALSQPEGTENES